LKKDGISIFKVDKNKGTVQKIGYQETGIHPRNFGITPNGKYLLCACRDSNLIQIYEIDKDKGFLTNIHKDIVIDKKRLLNNFMDLKSTMNIDIIFCVKALFSRNGLIYNMGNYIMLLNIIISFIYLILFYSKEYKNIFLKIREIIKSKKKEKKKNV
jgi:hypothetical protein